MIIDRNLFYDIFLGHFEQIEVVGEFLKMTSNGGDNDQAEYPACL